MFCTAPTVMTVEAWSLGEYATHNGWVATQANVKVYCRTRALAVSEAINYHFTGAYSYWQTEIVVD